MMQNLIAILPLALLASAIASSLADPSCLAKSQSLKAVTITNTVIDRGSPFNRENTTVSFDVSNAATGVSTTCHASDVALTPNRIGSDPYKWYGCATGAKAAGLEVVTQFQYDATLNFLTVNQTWVCETNGSKSLITALGWDELLVGCIERGNFSRTCMQGLDSKVEFAVDVTVKPL